jgi:hypothetical protein
MQQQHDDSNGWVKDAERWICQLQGVRQCKIDLDIHGEISGIHVVASTDREPRHIVRDVEGLLKARLDLSVYYKKIGVVQVLENGAEDVAAGAPPPEVPAAEAPAPAREPEPEPAPETVRSPDPAPAAVSASHDASVLSASPWPLGGADSRPAVLLEEAPLARVECAGVGVMVSGASLTATVELMRGDAVAQAREMGPNHGGMDMQLLARAAVGALTDLVDESVSLSVADVRQAEAAGEDVVVAVVDLVEGRRSERFFGVCSLAQGRQQAAVYAVLDALNRRLELMSFKEGDQD